MSPRNMSSERGDIEEGVLDAFDADYGDIAEAHQESLDWLPPDSKDRKDLLIQKRQEEMAVLGKFRSVQ